MLRIKFEKKSILSTCNHGKVFQFLSERNERIILKEIAQPPVEFTSALDVFEKTLQHEREMTRFIDEFCFLAREVRDNATLVFLEWFIKQQVEEEKNASDILSKLKKTKPDSGAFFMLDKMLGEKQSN